MNRTIIREVYIWIISKEKMDQQHPTEKKSNFLIYGVIIIVAIAALAFFSMMGDDNGERADIIVNDNDIIIGDKNAPVTIVEFTDFSCPFCAAASGYNTQAISALKSGDPSWEAPLPKINENYVKSGKVRVVMKYYPGHGTGMEAHRVGWCFYEQAPDKFFQYKGNVFFEQENTNNIELMKEIAIDLGANKDLLNQCLASKKYDAKINEQTLQGMNVGVKGTPTFFVNGIKIEGAASYKEFQKVIESELS